MCRSNFRVMDFLSQDESWFQRRGSFTDESVVEDAYANEDCRRTLSRNFDDIGLSEDVLYLVYRYGWEYASKIQMQSLQIILAHQRGILCFFSTSLNKYPIPPLKCVVLVVFCISVHDSSSELLYAIIILHRGKASKPHRPGQNRIW